MPSPLIQGLELSQISPAAWMTCWLPAAEGAEELPEELDELTKVAHTLPSFMALDSRVVLQFRNASVSAGTLMDRPVVGVPAYADALLVRPSPHAVTCACEHLAGCLPTQMPCWCAVPCTPDCPHVQTDIVVDSSAGHPAGATAYSSGV